VLYDEYGGHWEISRSHLTPALQLRAKAQRAILWTNGHRTSVGAQTQFFPTCEPPASCKRLLGGGAAEGARGT
jgi:hypothetical protein